MKYKKEQKQKGGETATVTPYFSSHAAAHHGLIQPDPALFQLGAVPAAIHPHHYLSQSHTRHNPYSFTQ